MMTESRRPPGGVPEGRRRQLLIHVEIGATAELIGQMRALGLGVGLAVNPETPLSAAEPWLDRIDLLLLMRSIRASAARGHSWARSWTRCVEARRRHRPRAARGPPSRRGHRREDGPDLGGRRRPTCSSREPISAEATRPPPPPASAPQRRLPSGPRREVLTCQTASVAALGKTAFRRVSWPGWRRRLHCEDRRVVADGPLRFRGTREMASGFKGVIGPRAPVLRPSTHARRAPGVIDREAPGWRRRLRLVPPRAAVEGRRRHQRPGDRLNRPGSPKGGRVPRRRNPTCYLTRSALLAGEPTVTDGVWDTRHVAVMRPPSRLSGQEKKSTKTTLAGLGESPDAWKPANPRSAGPTRLHPGPTVKVRMKRGGERSRRAAPLRESDADEDRSAAIEWPPPCAPRLAQPLGRWRAVHGPLRRPPTPAGARRDRGLEAAGAAAAGGQTCTRRSNLAHVHGRTAPCTNAIVAGGVARVVSASKTRRAGRRPGCGPAGATLDRGNRRRAGRQSGASSAYLKHRLTGRPMGGAEAGIDDRRPLQRPRVEAGGHGRGSRRDALHRLRAESDGARGRRTVRAGRPVRSPCELWPPGSRPCRTRVAPADAVSSRCSSSA